jgi:hypothetical protein
MERARLSDAAPRLYRCGITDCLHGRVSQVLLERFLISDGSIARLAVEERGIRGRVPWVPL